MEQVRQNRGQRGIAWAKIADNMPGRTINSCIGRYTQHLAPTISREPWSSAEDEKLRTLHAQCNGSWARIAKQLPGRTDEQVKTRWRKLTGSLRSSGEPWSSAEDDTLRSLRAVQRFVGPHRREASRGQGRFILAGVSLLASSGRIASSRRLRPERTYARAHVVTQLDQRSLYCKYAYSPHYSTTGRRAGRPRTPPPPAPPGLARGAPAHATVPHRTRHTATPRPSSSLVLQNRLGTACQRRRRSCARWPPPSPCCSRTRGSPS